MVREGYGHSLIGHGNSRACLPDTTLKKLFATFVGDPLQQQLKSAGLVWFKCRLDTTRRRRCIDRMIEPRDG